MNAMARGIGGNLSIYVPTKSGGLVQRSTGTSNKMVVRGMQKMVLEFKDAHRWALLDALTIATEGTGKRKAFKLSLKRAYQFWSSNKLAELEAELSAKNLADSLNGWIAWVRANRRSDVETADVYWQQVTTLVEPGKVFLAPALDQERVMAWLVSRDKTSSGTRRKYFYALKSFVAYLRATKVFAADPLAGMKAPKKDPARERWVTTDVDEAIVNDASLKYRAFFAFIKGTGCDLSAARRAQIGDVNVFRGTTTVRGTKTDSRKVFGANVEPWALPYIRPQLAARRSEGTHALLFPDIGRKPPAQHHKTVCNRLKVEGYTLKDSRHSVGVRMRLAGKTFEEIAAQLGTSVYQAVVVYTKYKPEDVAETKEAK